MAEKFSPTKMVISAIRNSELLLSHSAEHGMDIKPEQIKVLTEAKYLLEQNEWSRQIEAEFWIVYKDLSRLIQPVNVESLLASTETEIIKPSKIRKFLTGNIKSALSYRSVRMYTLGTLFTMIILLILQIYFFMGTTRLNKIQSSDTRIKELESRTGELMIILGTGSDNKPISLEKERLENELFELNAQKASNIQLLEPWVSLIRKITFAKNPEIVQAEVSDGPQNFAASMLSGPIETIQDAQNYVLILGLYILPLIFGLVGAFTYVLRELVQEIKDITFSKETNIKYLLRLQLGAIAGLAIGIFWGDIAKQQQFGLASLSPLLIAFIAGYSVEYVFSFIERSTDSFLRRKSGQNDSK
jgi:hypothetical protein